MLKKSYNVLVDLTIYNFISYDNSVWKISFIANLLILWTLSVSVFFFAIKFFEQKIIATHVVVTM